MRLYEFIDETAIKLSGASDKAKAWIKKIYDLYLADLAEQSCDAIRRVRRRPTVCYV